MNATRARRPVCSVVCLTYNHARFAEAALQSIFAQTYRDIEIVVVDDGSTDGTAAVVARVLATSPFPSKFLTQANTGNVPLNLNRALALASGEFVTFLSLDDMLVASALAARMAPMIDDDSVAFVAEVTYDQIDETDQTLARGLSMPAHAAAPSDARDFLELEFQIMGAFFIQSAVFRRDVVDAIGGFDADLIGDDIILRTKVLRHMEQTPGLTFRLITDVGLLYRMHGANIHRNTERQIRTIVQWRDRYFPDRPLSAQGIHWIEHWVLSALNSSDTEAVARLSRIAPEIEMVAGRTPMTWKMVRRKWKRRLFKALGGKS
jgi:alpha-1,3-rhamnosyltransferase